MLPTVFGVVLNHNGQNWLPRCLESLLCSDYPALRVLLVDNGSTDRSLEIARAVSPRVEILENGANLGFSAGNNAGIARALSEGAGYVALLNNDTHFEPQWLRRLIEVGEAEPRLGVLGPAHFVFDGSAYNTWMTSAFSNRLAEIREHDRPGAWVPVEWVEGSCLVVKRAVFEQIGLLDPVFFAFYEESDFCRRARAAGFEVGLVPSSRFHHHRGGYYGQQQVSRRREYLMLRSGLIYNSTDPLASLPANVLALLLCDLTNLKASLLGASRLGVWLQVNGSLLAAWPAVYRKWQADRATVRRGAASRTPAAALSRQAGGSDRLGHTP